MSLIMLVEDNPDIMSINTAALKMRGYDVIAAKNLEEADKHLIMHDPDVIVLDVMLPDGSGLEWCKRLHSERAIPVIFLSALGESDYVLAGLRSGGDDYLSKPYNLDVLIERIKLRIDAAEQSGRYISMGGIRLDAYAGTVQCRDERLSLTQKEFAVLHLLMRYSRRGKAIQKNELMETVWNQPIDKDGNALWTVISRLKTKLEDCGSGLTISFMRADGYRLERE